MAQKLLPEHATHKPKYSHCGYIRPMIETALLKENVDKAVEFLSKYCFDSIAFRGMSGALIAPVIAVRMNKTLIMVRKPGENNHSGMRVEGDYACRRYVIVDDFVSVGTTANAIRDDVRVCIPEAECLGVLEIREMMDNSGYRELTTYCFKDKPPAPDLGTGRGRPLFSTRLSVPTWDTPYLKKLSPDESFSYLAIHNLMEGRV